MENRWAIQAKVKMVGHEAIAVNLPARFLATFLQSGQETLTVWVVAEDGLTVIPTVHDVVDSTGVLDVHLASHRMHRQ